MPNRRLRAEEFAGLRPHAQSAPCVLPPTVARTGRRHWTPWEKIDLDIEGNHIMAFERHDSVPDHQDVCYLTWPVFRLKFGRTQRAFTGIQSSGTVPGDPASMESI